MPEPDMVETVAHAISMAVRKHRPTHDESRAMARAAIDAIDTARAIGYAVVVDTGNGHATALPTISQDLRMAEAIAAEVIGTTGVRALIVTITAVRRGRHA